MFCLSGAHEADEEQDALQCPTSITKLDSCKTFGDEDAKDLLRSFQQMTFMAGCLTWSNVHATHHGGLKQIDRSPVFMRQISMLGLGAPL